MRNMNMGKTFGIMAFVAVIANLVANLALIAGAAWIVCLVLKHFGVI